jgi:hypothetical protein
MRLVLLWTFCRTTAVILLLLTAGSSPIGQAHAQQAHEAALEHLEQMLGGGGHASAPHHHHSKVRSKDQKCGGWQQVYAKRHADEVRFLSPRSRMFVF